MLLSFIEAKVLSTSN